MKNGIVKWFNNERGYGFIVDEQGNDIFVHYSIIPGKGFRTLDEGQKVTYDLLETEKGLQATNVQIIEDEVEEVKVSI